MKEIEETLNRRIGQLLKGSERDIAKHYAQLMKDIRLLLSEYYAKFERGGELTIEEMAKYKRLEKLNNELKTMFKYSYEDIHETINRVLEDVFEEGYYLTAWGISNEVDKHIPMPSTAEMVIASVNNPISGLTLSERLEKNRNEIEWKIRETVTKGVAEGTTYGRLSNDLKKVLDNDKVKAHRIVRTEVHRVSEEGKQASRLHAHKLGILQNKKWASMKDERTRTSHEQLDGQEVPLDEPFEIRGLQAMQPGGFGVAKEDINCRCITTTEIVGIANNDLKERTAETYDEFLEEVKNE